MADNKEYKLNSVGWKLLPAKLLKGKCQVALCSRKRSGKSGYCSTHKRRLDKLRYPEYILYHWLKQNARKRGVEFSITLEYFKRWCAEEGFIDKKNSADKRYWSVDRKENSKGYVEGNLQAMPTTENAQKAWDEDYETHPAQKTWFQKKEDEEPVPNYDHLEDAPF